MSVKEEIYFEINHQGEIVSLKYDGCEFASRVHDGNLFRLQLRDFIGNPLTVERVDFAEVKTAHNGNQFEITYSDCRKLRGTTVCVCVSVAGAEIRWRIAAQLGGSLCRCEWVDFPRLLLRRNVNESFLLPFAEGTLVDHLEEREKCFDFKCEYSQYPLSGVNGFYPGPAAMQFMACFNGDTGLYVGCADD